MEGGARGEIIAMFREPTVFVLGAGASAHCGLPLGFKLNELITSGVSEVAAWIKRPESGPNYRRLPPQSLFMRNPYAYMLQHLTGDRGVDLPQRLDILLTSFSEALQSQTNFVIDQFLFENPEFEAVGKLCIAAEIIRGLYEDPDRLGNVMRKVGWRNKVENWYGHLINHARDGAVDGQELEGETQLSVVTFNYDPTLVEFLGEKFANTSRHAGADFSRCVHVEFVHGAIPPCGSGAVDFASMLSRAASNLTIVAEDLTKRHAAVASMRDRARQHLKNASRVYIFGFGFHKFNVEILRLAELLPLSETYCLNFDGNGKVYAAAREIGIPEANIIARKSIHDIFLEDHMSRTIAKHEFF